jgi:hypothetical protein
MTSASVAGQRGFRHELLLHRSTQELLDFVVPMVGEGVAAQEPTLLLVRPDTAEAVLHQVGPSPYLTVEPALTEPGRPALHVRAARPMLAGYARVVHQEPVIRPSQWPEWRRLEAVLNLALSYHDTWAVCAYDRRTLLRRDGRRPARHPPTDRPGRQSPAQRALPTPGRLPQTSQK